MDFAAKAGGRSQGAGGRLRSGTVEFESVVGIAVEFTGWSHCCWLVCVGAAELKGVDRRRCFSFSKA